MEGEQGYVAGKGKHRPKQKCCSLKISEELVLTIKVEVFQNTQKRDEDAHYSDRDSQLAEGSCLTNIDIGEGARESP